MESNVPPDSAAKRLAAYSFLVVFANDGTISEEELALLEKMALEDGVVDEAEKSILGNLFHRVNKETVTEAVWDGILRFKSDHGIE